MTEQLIDHTIDRGMIALWEFEVKAEDKNWVTQFYGGKHQIELAARHWIVNLLKSGINIIGDNVEVRMATFFYFNDKSKRFTTAPYRFIRNIPTQMGRNDYIREKAFYESTICYACLTESELIVRPVNGRCDRCESTYLVHPNELQGMDKELYDELRKTNV